ncbi:MAG: hypothetical protein ACOX1P_01900 [Thermoguttaceae bacterium]|jgi:hypothetical protein
MNTSMDVDFPKFASSAAHQNGTALTLTESFGVYGNGLTPAQIKWLVDAYWASRRSKLDQAPLDPKLSEVDVPPGFAGQGQLLQHRSQVPWSHSCDRLSGRARRRKAQESARQWRMFSPRSSISRALASLSNQ